MKDLWQNRLAKASRILGDEAAPVWWYGFHNVIARGESSHADDNPYLPDNGEEHLHAEYKAGAKAADSLKRYLAQQPSHRPNLKGPSK
jgi:hypothetical protein